MPNNDFWVKLRRLFNQPQTQNTQQRQPPQLPSQQVQSPQPVAPQAGPLSVSEKLAVIAQAGRERRLVQMKYDGVDRLVEPYSMRQGKNGALMYGFCSIHDKIHSFHPEKIESVKMTEYPYAPRWEVEF